MALNFLNNGYFAGKVGIGTESPGTKLHIKDGSSGFTGTFDARNKSIVEANGEAYFATYVPDNSFSGLRFFNSTALKGFIDYYHGTQGDALVYSATGYHKFITSGTEKVRIINNGNVGIGTESPSGKLEITSNSSLSSYITQYTNDADGAELVIRTARGTQAVPVQYNTGDSAGRLLFQAYTSAGEFEDAASIESVMESGSANAYGGLRFNFMPNYSPYVLTEGMRLNMSGNVGIGEANIDARLHISAKASNGISNVKLESPGASKWVFGIPASETYFALDDVNDNLTTPRLVVLKTSGNVGIGTVSPTTKLNVSGNIAVSSGSYLSFIDSNLSYNKIGRNTSVGGIQITTGASATMNLLDNGNVGIGTTSPSYKLEINSGTTNVTSAFKSTDNQAWISIQDDDSGTYGALIGIDSDESENFVVANASASKMLSLTSAGSFKLHNYDSTNQTGTPTYLLGTDASGNVVKTNTVPGSGAGPYLPLAGGTMTGTNGVLMPDNFRLKFGDATTPDLEIFHNGSNSYVRDSGTGGLVLEGSTMLELKARSGELYLRGNENSSVQLYHDNSKKFETTSTGVAVTGAAFINGNTDNSVEFLTVDDADPTAGSQRPHIKFTGAGTQLGKIRVLDNGTGMQFLNSADSVKLTIADTGNATFAGNVTLNEDLNFSTSGYADISNTGTGAMRFKPSSQTLALTLTGANATFAGNVTVSGTSSTFNTGNSGTFVTNGTSGYPTITLTNSSAQLGLFRAGNGGMYIGADAGGFQIFTTSFSEKFNLDQSGNGTFAGNINTGAAKYLRFNSAASGSDAAILFGNTSGTGGSLTFKRNSDSAAILTLNGDKNATFAGDITLDDNSGASPSLYLKNGDDNFWRIFNGSSLDLTFRVGTVTKFDIDSSGNGAFVGTVTSPTFLGDLNGTINTATTGVTQVNAIDNTTIATTAYVNNKIALIPAGLVFQGTWNASTNTPTLTSGSGTTGNFYIVSVAGSTNLDGITDWKVGDWAVFIEQGASDQWEKIDNSSVLDGIGTGQSVSMWSGSGTSNTLTDAPITISGSNTTVTGKLGIGALNTGFNLYNNGTTYLNGATTVDAAFTQSGGLASTFSGNVSLGDNKELIFGAATDFKIYHNSTTNVNHVSSQIDRQLSINGNIINLTNQANTANYLVLNSTSATFSGDVSLELNKSVSFNNSNDKIGSFTNGDVSMAARNHIGIYADSDGGGDGVIDFHTGDAINAGSPKMTILNSGDVGIGLIDPDEKLEIAGSLLLANNSDIKFNNSAGNKISTIRYNSSNQLIIANGNSPNGDIHFQSDVTSGLMMILDGATDYVGIGNNTSPKSMLDVQGGIKMADDTDTAVAAKVGTMRYRTSGNNSYVDMCMQTAASTYAWINIVQNNW